MKRAAILIGILAVPAIVVFRRLRNGATPGTCPSLADAEGDALPPSDRYIDDLFAAFCTLDCGCRGQWRVERCPSVIGCGRCVGGFVQ